MDCPACSAPLCGQVVNGPVVRVIIAVLAVKVASSALYNVPYLFFLKPLLSERVAGVEALPGCLVVVVATGCLQKQE